MIDTAYTGDPDGDMIDNDDAILPGAEGDDDYVRAGDGDDTILAGDGDDIVEAGWGSDVVEGGEGDDMITPATMISPPIWAILTATATPWALTQTSSLTTTAILLMAARAMTPSRPATTVTPSPAARAMM